MFLLFFQTVFNFTCYRFNLYQSAKFSAFTTNLHAKILFEQWRNQYGQTAIFNDYPNAQTNYNNRYKLYEFLLHQENLEHQKVIFLEFGVAGGDSIAWWSKHLTNENTWFFGFDSFEGLPQAWENKSEGHFSTQGNVPNINDSRCRFIKGLFAESLPDFIHTNKELFKNSRLIIHLDADLYGSTMTVLHQLAPFLSANTVLIFDEFSSCCDEFMAFYDFQKSYTKKYSLLASVNNYRQIGIKIT